MSVLLKKTVKSLLTVLLLCFGANMLFAQVLTVREIATHSAIPNVSVTWQKERQVQLTNSDGQVKTESISGDEVLEFSHPAYQSVMVKYADLSGANPVVYLVEKVIQIDEVVVSANKWEQNEEEVPNEILSVSAKDVVFYNPQTSADMLQQTGQVFMQKSQMGGGSPMIRGFSASSILIMLDGVRINNAIYRSGNLHNVISIDPNLLETTEVIFGPGSTLYGSDALGGVMDFKTLKPTFSFDKKVVVKGAAMLRYASANNEKAASVNLRLNNNRFSNVTGISFNDYDDLRTGSVRTSDFPDYGKRMEYIERINGVDQIIENTDVNFQKFSGYSQYNLMNKFTYRMGSKSELSYTIYHSNTSNTPRYDRLIRRNDSGVLRDAEWYYGSQFFMLNAISYINYNSNKLYDGLKIILSNQMVDESRHDRRYQSDNLRSRIENVDVYALNVDLDKKLSSNGELFYGVELLVNDVTSSAYEENIITQERNNLATRYPDGGSRYKSSALYASFKNRFNKLLVMTLGARYSYIQLDEEFLDNSYYDLPFEEINQTNDALSGTFGMVVSPSKKIKWNALFSTGFRAPNVDDMGKVFDSGGVVVIPNEDLKPEYTFNYETGIDWSLNESIRIESTVYYTNLNDAMVRRPFEINGQSDIVYDGETFPISSLVNVGGAYVWGYSLGVSAAFSERLGFVARINDSYGKDKIENLPLRHTHPFFGKVAFTFQDKKLRAELYTDFQSKRTVGDLAPSELDKPYLYTSEGSLGWMTINAKTAYQFSNSFSMTAAVENITDKHYRPYSSGISAAGINGVVSARYQF